MKILYINTIQIYFLFEFWIINSPKQSLADNKYSADLNLSQRNVSENSQTFIDLDKRLPPAFNYNKVNRSLLTFPV